MNSYDPMDDDAQRINELEHELAQARAELAAASEERRIAVAALEDAQRWADSESKELQSVAEALGMRYLDPPDGGDVPLGEQVRRMSAELAAARTDLEDTKALLPNHPDTGCAPRPTEMGDWWQQAIMSRRKRRAAEKERDKLRNLLCEARQTLSYPASMLTRDNMCARIDAALAKGGDHDE